ncbi:MAG: PHP domain-containing protein, partial [Anaerolineae bacterium]
MEPNARIATLETQLNDFDPHVRATALAELKSLAEQGYVSSAPPLNVVNMHCHTFFSFNAYGYSPSGLAWLAWRRGFRVIGIVDFDVLDGVEEFLIACEELGVRGTAGLETRVFIPQFATREINSPGEPGISYHMGIGFTSSRVPAEASDVLAHMGRLVRQRNLDIISRVNAFLAPVTIDYERDVLPLTPAGNPTERHIVVAYVRAAERNVSDPVAFWSERLKMSIDQVRDMMGDPARFQNTIRAKLMKQGGVGYVPPTHEAFPTVSEVHKLILACGALPCAAWLDGLSAGEQAIDELLQLLI